MRRAFFFIVAIVFATSSFASIPRASMLDRASEDASALIAPLSESRIRAAEVLTPFERSDESELTRALRQAYGESSTTSASGLRCFLSVDPGKDWDPKQPQSWNRYSYVMNNPLLYTDPTGEIYELYGFVNDADEQKFFQDLSTKTGLTVTNNNGKLDYARDANGNVIIATDANGNQLGSATARTDLMNGINSTTRYVVQRTDNNANVDMGVRTGALIRLDFADMRQINTGNNAAATFDSSMIFLHEGVGHAFLGLRDPAPNVLQASPTQMGPTVVWENKIRAELGLPRRNQYKANVHQNGKRYIPFANGPVWLP